jgi:anti-anti-sigma factor
MNNPLLDKTVGDAIFLKYSGETETDDLHLTGAGTEKYVRSGFRKVVLNMEKVDGLLSASISRIVEMIKAVTLAGGELFIVNAPERVLRILRSVKLDLRLKIYLSEKDFLLDYGLSDTPGKKAGPGKGSAEKALRLEKTLVGDAHFIAVEGLLLEDDHTGEIFDMAKAALDNGAKRLVFDLKKTQYIDSTSVSVFIRLRKLCLAKNASLEIVNAGEQVADVFNLTGLGALLASD